MQNKHIKCLVTFFKIKTNIKKKYNKDYRFSAQIQQQAALICHRIYDYEKKEHVDN